MKRIVLMLILICSHLLFSYNYFPGWWYASIGTALILLVSYITWRRDFVKMTGTIMTLKELGYSFFLVVLLVLISYLIMSHIGKQHGVVIQKSEMSNYILTIDCQLVMEYVVLTGGHTTTLV